LIAKSRYSKNDLKPSWAKSLSSAWLTMNFISGLLLLFHHDAMILDRWAVIRPNKPELRLRRLAAWWPAALTVRSPLSGMNGE
jgi:hypothetical protein